jgi:deazaflavin-dependent oxidoreductase (nitroreductase family)
MRLRGTLIGKVYSQLDRFLIVASKGRIGTRLRAGGDRPDPPVLVLETIGRKSGKARGTPLIYLTRPGGYVVVASNAGHPQHPAWWLNLRANPHASVFVDGKRSRVTASELSGAERAPLWSAMLELYPPLADYARDTERVMPVVFLRLEM